MACGTGTPAEYTQGAHRIETDLRVSLVSDMVSFSKPTSRFANLSQGFFTVVAKGQRGRHLHMTHLFLAILFVFLGLTVLSVSPPLSVGCGGAPT